MPAAISTAWNCVLWHLDWYADALYGLWVNMSPLGYVSICFACLGVGWIMLSNSVKQMGG